MKTRKVIYVTALIVMELASSGMDIDAMAQPEMTSRNSDGYAISIPQEKYETLLKYKFMVEENIPSEGSANMQVINDTIEGLYLEVDSLTSENVQLKKDLKDAKENPTVVEVPDKSPHLWLGGAALIDTEGPAGGELELSLTWRRVEPYVGVSFIGQDLYMKAGAKYRIR